MIRGLAFYDMDGTLVSSNVIHQYAWFARHHPQRALRIPWLWISYPSFAVELVSREWFNVVFFRQYRGMQRPWLEDCAEAMARAVLDPATFPGAADLVARDRAAGYRTVLLTGSLDFAVTPLARRLGFDEVVANRLEFDRSGFATGRLVQPLLAGRTKADAVQRLLTGYNVSPDNAKAYSDSTSDLPMLEAVSQPAAVNPSSGLRRVAKARGWPVLDLR
ncbi:MAG: HAD-IB family hydrolase [Acidobacteria bacterium]|nr:HAD-IB family hydrolase [Acidobacteriota bacterium]